MRRENTVDLGAVAMHKKVIGDIAAAALKDVSGVRLASFGLIGSLFELIGYKNFPGVWVKLDSGGLISLEIRVVIEYGLNIPTVASQIQDVVRAAVERAVDIELFEINVSIQSVERVGG